MDIRFINSANEIINASRLSIKVINNSLIGIDAEKNVVQIEEYESEDDARKVLKGVGEIILYRREEGADIVIDLRKEEENGESE